jgi:hypothetical protein
LASGCTSCAVEILPRGRITIGRMPAAAAYAASAAEVSPVDAHATAWIGLPSAIICLTVDTSTVIPRSLNDPVCETPHCFTSTARAADALAVAARPTARFASLHHRHDVRRWRLLGLEPTPSLPHTPSRRARWLPQVALVEQLDHDAALRAGAPRCRGRPRADRRTSGTCR